MVENRNPYYLAVEDVLVKVVQKRIENEKEGTIIEQKVDETPLLEVLASGKSKIDEFDYNRELLYDVVDTPANFLEDLVKGKVEILAEFIKKNGVKAAINLSGDPEAPKSKLLDTVHMCAIGGFAKSLDILTNEIRVRNNTYIYDNIDRNVLVYGAIRGNTDIIKVKDTARYLKNIVPKVFKVAIKNNNPKYAIAAANFCYQEGQQGWEAVIHKAKVPSLLTLAAHVVAYETLHFSSSSSSSSFSFSFSRKSLTKLPDKLFDIVCSKMSIYSPKNASGLLDEIEKDINRRVSVNARLDAAFAAEQHTRDNTYDISFEEDNFTVPLIDVFEEIDSFIIQPQDELEETSARFLASGRVYDTPSIVSKSQFTRQFRALTGGFFEGFDFSNVVVVGGSVVGALLPVDFHPETKFEDEDSEQQEDNEEQNDRNENENVNEDENENENENTQQTDASGQQLDDDYYDGFEYTGGNNNFDDDEYEARDARRNRRTAREKKEKEINEKKEVPTTPMSLQDYFNHISPFKGTDIDIYIYGLDNIQFAKKVEYIHDHLKKLVGKERIVQVAQSSGQVVFIPYYPYRNVQIVVSNFKNIWQILTGVDIDCSAFAYDGQKVWTTARGRYAMNYRWTIVNPDLYVIRGAPSYELRLVKYARRGFTIVDREYYKHESCLIKSREYEYINEHIAEYYILLRPHEIPTYYGAKLIAAIDEHKEVRQVINQCFKRLRGVPYGERVGEEEVRDALEDMADLTDAGYGPSETCLQFEDQLSDVLERIKRQELPREEPFEVPFWYDNQDKTVREEEIGDGDY